ncbi:hypothetical protein [Salinicoccus sp. HZC-1]|uniref:hypothetical protein n=1 Tax=Salinicoccus sp. HZC-1 TaxID=3385497 RepID=UPI00398B9251
MKSITSLLNKTLLSHFMGSAFWLTVLYLIGNILVQPFVLWILSVNMNNRPGGNEGSIPANPLETAAEFQLIGGMIYVVLLVLFLFNYRNKEDSVDFMHSLPVKRHRIMSHLILSGLIHITVPLLITAAILFFERYILNFDIALQDLALWLVYSLFILYVVFAVSLFAGLLVNSIYNHLQMVVIIFFLPVVFWSLNVSAAGLLFDGIANGPASPAPGDSGIINIVTNNTFPIFAVQQVTAGYDIWKMIIWALAGIVFIILSYILYNRSKNENVHYNFNHTWVRNLLAAVISITGMLMIGLMILFALPVSIVVTVLSFGIGLLFSYIVTEMFFQGAARISFNVSSIVTTLIFLIIFWTAFIIGWNQYVSYVPEAEDVAGISISSSNMRSDYGTYRGQTDSVSDDFLYIDDSNVIERTLEFHQTAIDSEKISNQDGRADLLEISYKMKDGSHIQRQFSKFEMEQDMQKDMAAMLNDGRFADAYDILFNIEEPEAVSAIDINGRNGFLQLSDGEELEAFIKDYQTAAHKAPKNAPMMLGNQNDPLAWVNVHFPDTNYQGHASIYNEALLERITADNELAEYLGITDAQEMYTASLSDDEKGAFFDDYNSSTFNQLEDDYDLETVEPEDRDALYESVNAGNLDASGDKVMLYKTGNADVYYPENGEETRGSGASETHIILGIE